MRRFLALDSLRGVCASMVVLMHFRTTGAISNNPTVTHGYLFVDFFFVLSGFVIAASYGEKLRNGFSIGKFMLLRLGRVYPLHVAVLLAFLAAHLALRGATTQGQFAESYGLGSFFASLTLTQIFIGPDSTFWNGPSWSIAAEVWTYLIFALLFRWMRAMVLPVATVVAAASAAVLFAHSPAEYHYINDFHDGALLRCLFGFGLGVSVFCIRAAVEPTVRGRLAWSIAEALVAIIAVIAISMVGGTALELLIPPLFAVAVFIFSQEEGALSGLLKTRPLRLIGTLSYSIYMIHYFLINKVVGLLKAAFPQLIAGDVVGRSELTADVASVAMLSFVIACSWVTYRLVESPAREWSRSVLLKRATPGQRAAEMNAPAL